MLSIAKLSVGHQSYFMELSNAEYYLSGGEPEGYWLGKGAKALGLPKTVTRRDLNQTFLGKSLRGENLVQNAGDAKRPPCWDLTFHMPKSLSVTIALLPQLRHRVLECDREAIKNTFEYIERNIISSRKGKAGRLHISADPVVAVFQHSCSREKDPSFHSHCLVMNLTVDADGTTRALMSKPLYQNKMLLGALYRSELANLLQTRIGLKCRPVKTWFEIDGVPTELCKLFSKRRQAIVKKLGELGLESASAAAFATLETRPAKTLVPPRTELDRIWQEAAKDYEFNIDMIIKRTRNKVITSEREDVSRVVADATNTISQKTIAFSEKTFLRECLTKAIAAGVSGIEVVRHAKKRLEIWDKTFKHIGEHAQIHYTTRDIQSSKKELSRYVDSIQARTSLSDWSFLNLEQVIGKYRKPRTVLKSHVDYHRRQFKRALQRKKTFQINHANVNRQSKQLLGIRDADIVRAIVRNRGSIQVLDTDDAAKAHLILRVCNDVWEKSNMDVWGFSLSCRAAKDLQVETGIRSFSLKTLELMQHPTLKHRVKHSVKELVRQALFDHAFPLEPFKTSKKILVVSEAQKLDHTQMQELLSAVNRHGGRLLLIGDKHSPQHRDSPYKLVASRVYRNDRIKTRQDAFFLDRTDSRSETRKSIHPSQDLEMIR